MENITEKQKELLENLKSQLPDLVVRWSDERGVALLLKGKLIPWQRIQEPEEILPIVIDKFGALIGPEDILDNHKSAPVRPTKGGGFRAPAYQKYKDLPIYGTALVAFADKERGVYRVQSSFWREVIVTAEKKIDENALNKLLYKRLVSDPLYSKLKDELRKEIDKANLSRFPSTSRPILYLHPVPGGFHPAYNLWAYQPTEWFGVDGKPRRTIDRVELMVDAATGEVLWEEPAKEGMAYNDTVGDGLSTLQDDSNNYIVRPLNIVRQTGGDYFLINRNTTPHIITHDVGGTTAGLETKLKNDNEISQDTDDHWNQTTTSCQSANRRDSQQPEVDGHFYAEEAWNFYNNLGWVGFDNGGWGDHCPLRIVAHIGMDANAYFSKYSEWDPTLGANKYYGYLAFYDGKCVGGSLRYDFMAGDPVLFGHEYQHAITFFGSTDPVTGEPGYLYGNEPWTGTIREGYSDALACLRRGLWINPLNWRDGSIRIGQPFRRIEYPRSTNTSSGNWYCDHYDDIDSTKSKYFHSTLLSHIAYLVGQGGVHQRTSRQAELMPVVGVGNERTAEIFLYALTEYFNLIPLTITGPTFIEVAQDLLDAAEEVSGSKRSCEYVMMRRALYAVGLYPYDDAYNKQTYGGEACMLPETHKWKYSQPYLGFPAYMHRSPDLFINNNGSQEYNAIVGQENKLFARVRNIGDQDLNDVRVRFYYRRYGTNLPADMMQWMPCQNMAGVDCVLDIPLLGAGEMNFTDADNPPIDQSVNWYIDPAIVTDGVDHFCVRAVIEFPTNIPPNHDNDCPNYVHSNISYIDGDQGDELGVSFVVQNWLEEPLPLDLRIQHTLPKEVELKYKSTETLNKIVLKRGEERILKWLISIPKNFPRKLLPPYDGKIVGKLYGEVSGPFEGELYEVQVARKSIADPKHVTWLRIIGMVSGYIGKMATVNGQFYGQLNLNSGHVDGRVKGSTFFRGGKLIPDVELGLEGYLEPLRVVHFNQFVKNKPQSGVTVKIRLPPFIEKQKK